MSQIQPSQPSELGKIEQVLMKGDLAALNEPQRLSYYKQVCESLGLNILTRPLDYIQLNGKLTLYATKGCAEQLRRIHKVSIKVVGREVLEGIYVVTAQASLPDGRVDESTGAVPIDNLKGEARANAYLKCETKAKRRVTLSICGLNMLDETEVESIPNVRPPLPVEQPSEDGGDGILIDEYKIPFGKWKARTIEQVYRDHGAAGISNYLAYLESTAEKEGKPIQGVVKDFIERCESYVAAFENAPVTNWTNDEPIPPMLEIDNPQQIN